MLIQLQVQHVATVERLDLELETGMTVLTGETGAGKSILLDALGLTLGDRADAGIVRQGADKAEVHAGFDIGQLPAVQAWLEERELATDGECLVRRVVTTDGRSRAYINGRPQPVQALKELGDLLVDIHGQHAHQSLLRRDMQRALLDEFGGHAPLLAEVTTHYQQWRTLQEELERLSRARDERDARLDMLRYQAGELEALALQPGELKELEEEQQRLGHAAQLLEGGQRAVNLLYEGDEGSVAGLLGQVSGELAELATFDPALGEYVKLLEEAAIAVRETAAGLRHYVADLELDPERLRWLEERLGEVERLARKHRLAADELPALLERFRLELEGLEGADARLESLEQTIAEARQRFLQAARRLSEARRGAGDRLAEAVTGHMQELGMKGGTFAIELTPLEEPAASGLERVEFLVTANAGQPLKPLAKVASGGELSRISLAIQVVTAGQSGIPTLIFDEVDVGIGGGVAEMVGRRLRAVAGNRQVLCVTHQPQVAAQGHHHLRIHKESGADAVQTRVGKVEKEARVEEIARMLGGLEITDKTLSHAREMIKRAAKG